MVKKAEDRASEKNVSKLQESGAGERPKKRGWNEIESLFSVRKEEKKKREEDAKKESKKRPKLKSAPKTSIPPSDEFIDDGLGGKYNSEGFTGRIEDGVKIFKAHVLQKPNAGMSDKCPFDCDCCYI